MHWFEVRGCPDPTFLDHDACILVRVVTALSSHHVFLAGVGSSGVDIAVLKHRRRVSKNEVNCSGDVAVDEELAEGVDVQSVLVSQHVASVEGG